MGILRLLFTCMVTKQSLHIQRYTTYCMVLLETMLFGHVYLNST